MEQEPKKNYWLLISIIAFVIIAVDLLLLVVFIGKYKKQDTADNINVENSSAISQTNTTVSTTPIKQGFPSPSSSAGTNVTETTTSLASPDAEITLLKSSGNCYSVRLVYTKRQIGSLTLEIIGNITNLQVKTTDKSMGSKIIDNQVLFLPTKDAVTSAQDLATICFDSTGPTSFKSTAYEYGTGDKLQINVK